MDILRVRCDQHGRSVHDGRVTKLTVGDTIKVAVRNEAIQLSTFYDGIRTTVILTADELEQAYDKWRGR
jgi:hypothetical protein